jgi:hypothetical protein
MTGQTLHFTIAVFASALLLTVAVACSSDQRISESDVSAPPFYEISSLGQLPPNEVHEVAKVNPGKGCYCDHKTICACCDHLDIPRFRLNETGCIELIYLPEELGASLILEINNYVLVNKTVSARNPPPLCYNVPDLDNIAQLCVQVYDLDLANKVLTGCARVLAEIEGHDIFKLKIGCFKLPMLAAQEQLEDVEEEIFLVAKEEF